MTLNTLFLIVIWLFAIALLGGLIFVIFLFGRRSIKDNPKEALVLVKNGLHINPAQKAKQTEVSKSGYYFTYGKNIVFVPKRYHEAFYKQRRLLFINETGQLIASPFADDVKLSNEERENLIYELCSGHIGADALRALRGKNTMTNVVIIAIVAFLVGAVLVYAFTQFQQSRQEKQNNVTIQQQGAPAQVPVEVK